jgi:hypothetical protein
MRCLYCGKELALLKRWTGGGEFCSDAHRQQYQEEYNKLALNRLLQAQITGEAKPVPKKETKPAELEVRPAAKAEPPKAAPRPEPQPKLEPKPAPEPVMPPASVSPKVEAPEPVKAMAIEEPETVEESPAESTHFLIELPVPAIAQTAMAVGSEYDFVRTFSPTIPEWKALAWCGELAEAGQVALEPSGRTLDYVAAQLERKLEVREFVRSAPMPEFNLRPVGEAGLLETSEEPMDILIFPHPPQGTPPLWQEAEQEFKFDTQLGALGLVAFATTGVEDNVDNAVVERSVDSESAATADEPPAVTGRAVIRVEEKLDPVPEPKAPELKVEVKPQPARVAQPVVPQVATPVTTKIERTSRPVFVRPTQTPPPPIPLSADKPRTALAQTVPEKKKEEPVPMQATKPLPLTLHGLAAGRGKTVQVFATAVNSGVEVQIPRSNGAPLRPVMVVGTITKPEEKKIEERKPAERTVVIKSDPKRQQQSQPQPGRPDPRFANGKGRKPDVRVSEPGSGKPELETPDAGKKEEKVAAVAAAVKESGKEPGVEKRPLPQTKPAEPQAKPAPTTSMEQKPAAAVKEIEKPVRISAPYTTPDLGLPNLSLESSGFWSKLPIPAKVGAAAVLVLGIALTVMLGGKGKSAAAGSGTVVEAGTPLPVIDSGWITDWGAETGVRKVHEISVLRPSLTLSDYRIEFQAQIESKALGWVYRAQDGKNYYVNRLEIVKPGLDPTVALVRFAVINGEEQPRAQLPLNLSVHVDTLYKVRFDAVGDRFTTWVQDQKVDEWADGRIKIGGVGLYNERGERMSLKGGVSVVPLAIRK